MGTISRTIAFFVYREGPQAFTVGTIIKAIVTYATGGTGGIRTLARCYPTKVLAGPPLIAS